MSGNKATYDVTMIGTLPPLKGISPYCAELALLLSERLKVEFLDFKRLYPERLYPGKTEEEDLYPAEIGSDNIKRRRILDFFNPYTWMKAGLSLRGRVVHAQWWTGVLSPIFLVVLFIARMRGKRVIITVHNVDPHEGGLLYNLLNRSILPLGNEFIVHGDEGREKLVKRIRTTKKVHVVPHPPFNSARDSSGENVEVEAVRARLGVADGNPLIIFFGNIRGYKGLDILLKALPRLINIFPGMSLLIAGQLWGDWDRYQRIIEDGKTGGSIITRLEHLPFRELKEYIVASDLAVFPFTHLDSASGSVMLACSLGKTIVASEIGDMRGMKAPGVFLAKPGCPESLAEAILEALEHSGEDGWEYNTSCEDILGSNTHEIAEKHIRAYNGSVLSGTR
ncbi:MAG: glycosyltransferase [Actinobacteria bacterium]|nr:glycosyltransferase [Actinomycetota bacterium]